MLKGESTADINEAATRTLTMFLYSTCYKHLVLFPFPSHFLGFKAEFFARKGKRCQLSNVLVSTSMRSLPYIGFSFRA